MNENNKRKMAVALSYDNEKDTAPKVTATGKGIVAETIIKTANEEQVPIVEDASLVELLSKINVSESIPENLYKAVAEVFAFIYEVDRKYDKENSKNKRY